MTKKDKNNQNINSIPKYLWGNYFKKPIKWLAHLINNYGNSKLSFITTGTSYAYAIADEKRKHPELTELQIKENVDLRIKQNRKKLGLPTENTPSLAAAGLALGSLYYPWLAVPDIIFDTAASIDEPSTSNNLHTIADFPETVAKFTPSKIDDYVAKGILTLGNIDDAISTSGRNMFSIFDKKTGKINNTVDKTSVRESTNIRYRKNGGQIRKMQTGAGGGFTSLITVPFLPNIKEIRHRLYNGINPSGYQHIPERIWDALNKKKANRSVYRDDQWATYLQIPEEERHSGVEKLQPARYRPSIGNTNGDVYRIPLNKEDADVLILRALLSGLGLGKNMVDRSLAHYLGDHTVGRGYDEKGEYISYYDKYDLNPFTGGTAIKTGVKEIDKWLKDNTSNIDMSMGIGKPFEIYDRIYLDDYYKVPKEARGATYLPEIIVTGKKKQGGKMNILEFLKNGSGIHIKEKNKGKFTSYCGGKVTDECIRKAKASGNPTLVKRATFAANARKWKHKEGGIIIKAADGTKTNFFLKVENFLNSDLGKTVGIGLVNAFSNWTSSNKLNNAIDSLIEGLKKQNKADINSIQNWALQKATEEVNLEFNKLLLLFNSGASFEQPSPIVFEHLKSQLASKYAQKAIDYVNLNSQEDIANLESLKTNPISDVFSSLANTGINYFANKALNKNGVPSSRNTNTSFYSNPYLKTLNKVGTINSNGSMNTGIGGTTYNWNTNTFGSNNTMNSFGNIKF